MVRIRAVLTKSRVAPGLPDLVSARVTDLPGLSPHVSDGPRFSPPKVSAANTALLWGQASQSDSIPRLSEAGSASGDLVAYARKSAPSVNGRHAKVIVIQNHTGVCPHVGREGEPEAYAEAVQ